MSTLITGAAGFIGSHLTDHVLKNGNNHVIGLDNLLTGKESNISHIKNNFTFQKADLRNTEEFYRILKQTNEVYHLAAQISVVRSVKNPLLDADINIKGILNLLEGVRKHDVNKVVFVSTGGAIYGEPSNLPADEDTEEEPLSPYGLSKLASEKYLKWYNKEYGIPYSIIRPANVFGPRQDPLGEAGVISIFLGKVLGHQPLVVFGDGKDTRDYVNVMDVVDACYKAMNSKINDTYNVGTGIETSVLDLINIIKNVTNSTNIKVDFNPPRPGDVQRISLDSSKIKKLLNWIPKVSLEEGIQEVWKWFVNQ